MTTIPYIRKEIDALLIFRALGILADREILELICYDLNDKKVKKITSCVVRWDQTHSNLILTFVAGKKKMMEMLKPSLEAIADYHDAEISLSYIATKGSGYGIASSKRIQYAREVLQREMLPHVGLSADCSTKKAYFMGKTENRKRIKKNTNEKRKKKQKKKYLPITYFFPPPVFDPKVTSSISC